jgi:hypothetical protein
MPVASRFNPENHQRTVENWSRYLKFVGYFIIISALMNIFGNVMFLFVMDSFTTIGWYDSTGIYHKYKLTQGGIVIMVIAKAILCILYYK